MTEFWVSQGNKWCDTCKIYISNNPASIRNHELGQRHKDGVTKRLNTMREDKAKKDKELKQAAKLLEQIETKANRSYQKDLASFQEARESNAQALIDDSNLEIADGSSMPGEWEHDSTSGYYYNQTTGFHYDPNSGFYYSDSLGKWVPQEEALAAFHASSASMGKRPTMGKPPSSLQNKSSAESKTGSTSESGPPPGRLVSTPLNPMRSMKGSKSSVAVKRKRADERPKPVSKEESAALKAREAAKKRVEEREKALLGLYRH